MAEITSREVSYPGDAGRLRAYVAHPAGDHPRPAVVVVQEWWIQRADVERLAAALKKFGKKGEARIYEGCDHGFFNDTRKDVYAPDAANDAWQRTPKLFAENLNG